jgi:hypothetical protein
MRFGLLAPTNTSYDWYALEKIKLMRGIRHFFYEAGSAVIAMQKKDSSNLYAA